MYLSFYERIGRPYGLFAEGDVLSEDLIRVQLTEEQAAVVRNLLSSHPVIAVAIHPDRQNRGTYQYKGYGELESRELTIHVIETFRQLRAS